MEIVQRVTSGEGELRRPRGGCNMFRTFAAGRRGEGFETRESADLLRRVTTEGRLDDSLRHCFATAVTAMHR